jgi:hypothetical protein
MSSPKSNSETKRNLQLQANDHLAISSNNISIKR